MKKLVIVPGGFHPWHGGHSSLYNAAKETFPTADVFVASTDDTSERPFPFKIKKILAQAAGVPGNRFIQVRSPFRAQEITQLYDPETTELIFVRSEKDRDEQPQPGGIKKSGDPSYLQPYKRSGRSSFDKHAYMAYLPVQQFGGGLSSATEIRSKWPTMSDQKKVNLVNELYPSVAGNDRAAGKLVEILNSVLGTSAVDESADALTQYLSGKPTASKLRIVWPGLTSMEKRDLVQKLYGKGKTIDPLRIEDMIQQISSVLTRQPAAVDENLISPMIMPVAESKTIGQDYLDEA
jgi:hypothetical protein